MLSPRPALGPLLLTLVALAACAPFPTPPVATPPVATPPISPAAETSAVATSIRWYRTAAEQRALYLQTYRAASDRLRELAAGETGGSWAVILDADETVLDNSTYQLRNDRSGRSFDPETWNAWVREEAATALPGAVEFTRLARELGGRVVIVTNRAAAVCPETRRNLDAVGVHADAVLCQEGPSDKNPRFQAVQRGGVAGLPPLEVLLWVGDNIRDFPGLGQELRQAPAQALEPFGRVYFILPNPMYGSWEAAG